MKFSIHPSNEIYSNRATFKRLKFLTNGGWGRHYRGSGMLDKLELKRESTIFICKINEGIVAWAMATNQINDPKVAQIDIYVSCHHRRRGIGTKLLNKVKKYCEDNNYTPVRSAWDLKGDKFYSKNKISEAENWEHPHYY